MDFIILQAYLLEISRSESGKRQRDYVKTLAISSCHNISYSFVNKSNANVFIYLSFELQFKKP